MVYLHIGTALSHKDYLNGILFHELSMRDTLHDRNKEIFTEEAGAENDVLYSRTRIFGDQNSGGSVVQIN